MKNNEERYVNVTLKNESDKKTDVVISISSIWKILKKYFIIWVVIAVVSAVLVLTSTYIFGADQHKTMTALVSFTFDGIEDGLDPEGNKFDVNTIKSPTVIEQALTELNHPLDEVEIIRQNIRISGIIPRDARDRITVYKSIYETGQNNAMNAAQAMLDTKYFPTQYNVTFNYAQTNFSNDDAVEIFNKILECYYDYFFTTYGYNEALGSAVTALDYTTYDYAEAVDVFSSTLTTLRKYVSALAEEDTTRFRSAETGYTFSDLSEAIKAIETMDLDRISSYITVNNVTKDKNTLISYYEYRIDALTRQKNIAQDNLNTVTQSIETYVKDSVIILNGGDENSTQYTQASDQYDQLIRRKLTVQDELSTAVQQITFYNDRIKALRSKPAGSDANKAKVEEDLVSLNEKVTDLIDKVNMTADEYYNTVSFANAYNILVPASASSVVRSLKSIIDDSFISIFILEALIFVIYLGAACVIAIVGDNKKKHTALAAAAEAAEEDSKKKEEKEEK